MNEDAIPLSSQDITQAEIDAVVAVMRSERATPVFVDIDPTSYNMAPAAIEAAITPRTKAILPVEVFGNIAHFDEYERIAKKHSLLLIEDCCEALGARLNGRQAGNFGQCGVFAKAIAKVK